MVLSNEVPHILLELTRMVLETNKQAMLCMSFGDFKFEFDNRNEEKENKSGKRVSPSKQKRDFIRKCDYENKWIEEMDKGLLKKKKTEVAVQTEGCFKREPQYFSTNIIDALDKVDTTNEAFVNSDTVDVEVLDMNNINGSSDVDEGSSVAVVASESDSSSDEVDFGITDLNYKEDLPFLSEETKFTILDQKAVTDEAIKNSDEVLFKESNRLRRRIKRMIKEDRKRSRLVH